VIRGSTGYMQAHKPDMSSGYPTRLIALFAPPETFRSDKSQWLLRSKHPEEWSRRGPDCDEDYRETRIERERVLNQFAADEELLELCCDLRVHLAEVVAAIAYARLVRKNQQYFRDRDAVQRKQVLGRLRVIKSRARARDDSASRARVKALRRLQGEHARDTGAFWAHVGLIRQQWNTRPWASGAKAVARKNTLTPRTSQHGMTATATRFRRTPTSGGPLPRVQQTNQGAPRGQRRPRGAVAGGLGIDARVRGWRGR
jgi:hypothetical protein